jgi:hypothetical protein
MVPCCIPNYTFEIESDRVSRMTRHFKEVHALHLIVPVTTVGAAPPRLPTPTPSSPQCCASGDSSGQLPAAAADSGTPWVPLLLQEDRSTTLFPNRPRRIASMMHVAGPPSRPAVPVEKSDRHRRPTGQTPPCTSGHSQGRLRCFYSELAATLLLRHQ